MSADGISVCLLQKPAEPVESHGMTPQSTAARDLIVGIVLCAAVGGCIQEETVDSPATFAGDTSTVATTAVAPLPTVTIPQERVDAFLDRVEFIHPVEVLPGPAPEISCEALDALRVAEALDLEPADVTYPDWEGATCVIDYDNDQQNRVFIESVPFDPSYQRGRVPASYDALAMEMFGSGYLAVLPGEAFAVEMVTSLPRYFESFDDGCRIGVMVSSTDIVERYACWHLKATRTFDDGSSIEIVVVALEEHHVEYADVVELLTYLSGT